MKTYFLFSDVHGQFDALYRNLINQDFDEYNDNHILVSLGDLFDRGPQSDKVLEFCYEYYKKGRFIGLDGNHDTMLYGYLIGSKDSAWHIKHNGLEKTIKQLAGVNDIYDYQLTNFPHWDRMIARIYNRYPYIMQFLKSLVDEFTVDNFILTHGGMSLDSYQNKWEIDNWAKTPLFINNFDPKDKIYIFGHWGGFSLNKIFYKDMVTEAGDVFVSDHFIGIDGYSNISNKVNVLRLNPDAAGKYTLEVPATSFRIVTEDVKKE